MSTFGRFDPGPCAVCGAAHSACTDDGGPITVAQLPSRDAAAAATRPALVADEVQATLPPGTFTSATYRGKKRST
jgi:hypothetical protein